MADQIMQAADHRPQMLAVVEAKMKQAARNYDVDSNKERWLHVMDALARWRGRLMAG